MLFKQLWHERWQKYALFLIIYTLLLALSWYLPPLFHLTVMDQSLLVLVPLCTGIVIWENLRLGQSWTLKKYRLLPQTESRFFIANVGFSCVSIFLLWLLTGMIWLLFLKGNGADLPPAPRIGWWLSVAGIGAEGACSMTLFLQCLYLCATAVAERFLPLIPGVKLLLMAAGLAGESWFSDFLNNRESILLRSNRFSFKITVFSTDFSGWFLGLDCVFVVIESLICIYLLKNFIEERGKAV